MLKLFDKIERGNLYILKNKKKIRFLENLINSNALPRER